MGQKNKQFKITKWNHMSCKGFFFFFLFSTRMERSCIPPAFPGVLCPEVAAVGWRPWERPIHLSIQARAALGTSFLRGFNLFEMFILSISDHGLSEMRTVFFLPKGRPYSRATYLRGTWEIIAPTPSSDTGGPGSENETCAKATQPKLYSLSRELWSVQAQPLQSCCSAWVFRTFLRWPCVEPITSRAERRQKANNKPTMLPI